MGKVRILRKNGKAYIELPAEVGGQDELELYQLKRGYYLLSLPLGKERQVSETDKEVLRKLLSIRFEKRTPPYVAKVFSDLDMGILKELQDRKFVTVFKSKKYRQGVYNINDNIYPLIRRNAQEKPAEPARKTTQQSDSFTLLKTQGFAIIKDKKEAFGLSQRLKETKGSSAVGVKGFDGKFYIVTKEYLSNASERISSVLKEDMDPASIAEAAKLDPDGCMAVIRLMAENGEIIEKKKGVFAAV